MDFKVGDVVVLKSGGPKMTIKKFVPDKFNESDHEILLGHCDWFTNGQLQSAIFSLEELEVCNNNG